MNNNIIKQLAAEQILKRSPEDLLKFFKDSDSNFFKKNKLGTELLEHMINLQFPVTEKEKDSINFIFWLSYYMERSAELLIIETEEKLGVRKEFLSFTVERMTYGDKINILEKLYIDGKGEVTKIMRKIQKYRNDIAHGRFGNLKYKGYDFKDEEARFLIMTDFKDAFLKDTK